MGTFLKKLHLEVRRLLEGGAYFDGEIGRYLFETRRL